MVCRWARTKPWVCEAENGAGCSGTTRGQRLVRAHFGSRILDCPYNAGMTLVEVIYELQSPLQPEQLRALGVFANTYGLRRFHVDEERNLLSVEYDASRLKESQVAHALRLAQIPVQRKV